MRLFVASFLEPACCEQALAFQQANLAQAYKMVPRKKLHLTFAFIGDVPNHKLDDLQNDLAQSLHDLHLQKPLEIIFDRVEAWPDWQAPRVIVAVPAKTFALVAAGAPIMRAGEVSRAVAARYGSNQKQDHRLESFKPHITLIRLKAKCSLMPKDLKGIDGLILTHRITKICLVESDIRSHDQAKGNYKIIASVWQPKGQDRA